MLQTFIREERGDIVQYVIILALLAVVLAFAAPWLKSKIKTTQTSADSGMNNATTAIS